ncbi:RHS repeat-associated core domain-containing protein [Pectobacterium aroidearum]
MVIQAIVALNIIGRLIWRGDTHYQYDQIGRRVGKRSEQTGKEVHYQWDGDQIEEVRYYRNGERVARRHWVHSGWELLVQQPEQRTTGPVQTRRHSALAGTESGLCYNRFRYYDPAGGCYVSPDPIGVLGSDNNYGYIPNPNTWVDPFGLAGCSLNPKDIHFMQSSIKNQTGYRTVLDNAKALSNGSLKASDLPAIKV